MKKKAILKTYQNYLKYLKAGSQISFNQARNHHKKIMITVTNRMSGMFKFRITKKAHVNFLM